VGGVSFAQRKLGGLCYDDDDQGHAKAMDEEDSDEGNDLGNRSDNDEDEEEEEEEEAEVKVTRVLEFPTPQPAISYNGNGTLFRFNYKLLNVDMSGFVHTAVSALNGHEEVSRGIKELLAMHPTLPTIVHGSPLLAAVRCLIVTPKGTRLPAWEEEVPSAARYESWMFSAYRLQQLKMLVDNPTCKFHASMTVSRLKAATTEFQRLVTELENVQNERLQQLFDLRASLGPGDDAVATVKKPFVEYLVDYNLRYIHLLEYFLYSVLLAPAAGADGLRLEQVLTPRAPEATLALCSQLEGNRVIGDVETFLRHKQQYVDAQRERNVREGREDTDRHKARIDYGSVRARLAASQNGDAFQGFLADSVLSEYFQFLDV
jgi:hypothetical protein